MERNAGLTSDPLFVGMTRPPMKLGVTYAGLIVNVIATTELFILTKNLAWLLAFAPIHGVLALVCAHEPRFFDLLQGWGRTRGAAIVAGRVRFWRASTVSPLPLDLPDARGRRREKPAPVVL